MRVRTADVKINLAEGVRNVFALAVERNLAWLVGTGRVYAELEKVASKHGYLLKVVENEEDESLTHWVAVRANLVHEGIVLDGNGYVAFAFERDELGSVGIGLTDVSFNRVGDEDRITKTTQGAAISSESFDYFDQVYTVTALKN